MAQTERHEEAKVSIDMGASVSPALNRRQFLALCAAGASAVLFGAACGGEGEDGDDEEQEEQDDEDGGDEEGDGEQDEGGY